MTITSSTILPRYRSLAAAEQPPASPPADQPPAPPVEEKPGLIRRGIEGVAGLVGGTVSAVFHTPLGVFAGIGEALAEEKNTGRSWSYTLLFLAESTAIGAAAGAVVGGPAGVALGAGAGLLGGLLGRGIMHYAAADKQFLHGVQQSVDAAVADNNEGTKTKIMVQNFTEGALVGFGSGAREGWNIGVQAGKGAVSGVLDVVEGIAGGLWEVVKPKKG